MSYFSLGSLNLNRFLKQLQHFFYCCFFVILVLPFLDAHLPDLPIRYIEDSYFDLQTTVMELARSLDPYQPKCISHTSKLSLLTTGLEHCNEDLQNYYFKQVFVYTYFLDFKCQSLFYSFCSLTLVFSINLRFFLATSKLFSQQFLKFFAVLLGFTFG